MAAWANEAEEVTTTVGEGFDAVVIIIVIVDVVAGIIGAVAVTVAVVVGVIGV